MKHGKNAKTLGIVSRYLAIFCLVPTTHASVLSFTDEVQWIAALGSAEIITQDFQGEARSFEANSSGNSMGDITVDLVGGIGDSGPSGLTGSGFFQGEVDAGRSSVLSLVFHIPETFGFSILGLQNDSASTPKGLHLEEIGISVGSHQWLISDILGISTVDDALPVANAASAGAIPFLGFLSDSQLDQFALIPGEDIRDVSGNTEEFYLSGLQYAASRFTDGEIYGDKKTVPEPSSLFLFSAGILGLIASRRDKTNQVSMRE